ncbi:hypothetical protein R75777_02882 [Paraburkholderia nemoris]|nr:hypothetical protein R75777_02882 [Paraburkholderia nemoris]
MYSISTKHERRLLWLLALTQFTIMDFMVMMPLGPQIMHSFSITPAWHGNHKTLTLKLIASFSWPKRLAKRESHHRGA